MFLTLTNLALSFLVNPYAAVASIGIEMFSKILGSQLSSTASWINGSVKTASMVYNGEINFAPDQNIKNMNNVELSVKIIKESFDLTANCTKLVFNNWSGIASLMITPTSYLIYSTYSINIPKHLLVGTLAGSMICADVQHSGVDGYSPKIVSNVSNITYSSYELIKHMIGYDSSIEENKTNNGENDETLNANELTKIGNIYDKAYSCYKWVCGIIPYAENTEELQLNNSENNEQIVDDAIKSEDIAYEDYFHGLDDILIESDLVECSV